MASHERGVIKIDPAGSPQRIIPTNLPGTPTAEGQLRRVFFLVAASILGDTALYGVLPVYALDRGIPLVWVGVILSANRLVRLITNPVAAWLHHRIGTRTAFPAAMLTAAVTTTVYGLTTHVTLLVAARLFWGFTWSVVRLAGFDMIATSAPTDQQGWWMGRFRSTFRMGSLVASSTAGLMADNWGYTVPFLLFAVVSGMGAAAAYAARRQLFSPPTQADGTTEGAAHTDEPADDATSASTSSSSRKAWPVWALGSIVAWVAEGLVPSTLGFLVLVKLGDSLSVMGVTVGAATFTGFLLSFRWICDLVIAPAAGKMSDRWGVAYAATGIFLAAGALLPVLLTLSRPAPFAFTAMALLAGLSAAITLSEVVAIRTARGAGKVNHLSRYATAADAGSALGPLGGYALGAGIGIAPVYALGAVLLASAVALARRTTA